MASFSVLETVLFIIAFIFNLSQSRQFENFANSVIGIEIKLNIGPDSTTLQLASETHEWIAIAFNATSMSSGSWSTVYFSSTKSIHDSYLNTATPTTNPPSLTTSQWTTLGNRQTDMEIKVTLNRQNQITSTNPNYVDFGALKYETQIPIIIAFGRYADYQMGHTRATAGLLQHIYIETETPTSDPTQMPSALPSLHPTMYTLSPSNNPTDAPTTDPTTLQPTMSPTCSAGMYNENTREFDVCYGQNRLCCSSECIWSDDMKCDDGEGAGCCYKRTPSPTLGPTSNPTVFPTMIPSSNPSLYPTSDPTAIPTAEPTTNPTSDPTIKPTANPSMQPSSFPTQNPSVNPTNNPSSDPSIFPTHQPSVNPTSQPTVSPSCPIYANDDSTDEDDICFGQTQLCCSTQNGACKWSQSEICGNDDGAECCYKPTQNPTKFPTTIPTKYPTSEPSSNTTSNPSSSPTRQPTKIPTSVPTKNTICQCTDGINQLDLKYTGTNMVDSIEVYSKQNGKKRKICKEKKVQKDDIISCERSYGFAEDTYFTISYSSKHSGSGSWSKSGSSSEEGSEMKKCSGSLDTSCSKDLVGEIVNGCEDLMVVGWRSMNENVVCDESVSGNVMPHQAINNDEEKTLSVKSRGFDGELLQIGLIIAASLILIVSVGLLVRCAKKMNTAIYRGHKRNSTEIEGLDLMVSQDLRHRATLSMNNSFVVEMNDSDYVDEDD